MSARTSPAARTYVQIDLGHRHRTVWTVNTVQRNSVTLQMLPCSFQLCTTFSGTASHGQDQNSVTVMAAVMPLG